MKIDDLAHKLHNAKYVTIVYCSQYQLQKHSFSSWASEQEACKMEKQTYLGICPALHKKEPRYIWLEEISLRDI